MGILMAGPWLSGWEKLQQEGNANCEKGEIHVENGSHEEDGKRCGQGETLTARHALRRYHPIGEVFRVSRRGRASVIAFFLLASCTGSSSAMAGRLYQHEAFTFSIPGGWKTMDEVFGHTASSRDYYGLGVREIVTIQHPAIKGQGKGFFAVASSPLERNEDLETRFKRAYRKATLEMRNVATRKFQKGDLSGYEITYIRPWGTPWWRFRDIWVEREGMIYLLSFHALPESFEGYSQTFEEILGSFRFKERSNQYPNEKGKKPRRPSGRKF
jgi:hypothetical protein